MTGPNKNCRETKFPRNKATIHKGETRISQRNKEPGLQNHKERAIELPVARRRATNKWMGF